MTTQQAIKTSRSNSLQPFAKSALDKNLSASANSKKPSVTFTAFNHPPAFPSTFNLEGKKANKAKGYASANENPNMPVSGPQ